MKYEHAAGRRRLRPRASRSRTFSSLSAMSVNRDLSNAGSMVASQQAPTPWRVRRTVSGHALACPLSIDREQDRVLGECDEISAGLERSVVLEYFVLIDGALLVLAQQGGRIDLTSVEEPRQNVVIQPALATRRCLGNLEPAEINFSVCDNDGDGMENLAEYCNEEREPLIAEQSGEP